MSQTISNIFLGVNFKKPVRRLARTKIEDIGYDSPFVA